MPAPRRQTSPAGQTAYKVGEIMMTVGFILFLTTCVIAVVSLVNLGTFGAYARASACAAIAGVNLIAVGRSVSYAGLRKMAGAGVVLDPEQARRDLEPHARMAGGLVKDALDEADIRLGAPASDEAQLPFDERLRRLHQVRQEGLISEAEYQAAKAKLLAEV